MPGGFRNKPKILRGAFVEYDTSTPRLIVPFQFNPVQLTRNRNLSFSIPNEPQGTSVEGETDESRQRRMSARQSSLRQFHQRDEFSDLSKLQRQQVVNVQEESISFEIRLDATDKLNDGDPITMQFGIAPQLTMLELMVQPEDEMSELLKTSSEEGYSFTRESNPPLILFTWGRKRILPVNINSMNITETEFSTELNPIRATVSVSLTVIEGPNEHYTKTKSQAIRDALSAPKDVTNVVIPG